MLCYQCRRLAATIAKQSSTTISQRGGRLINTSSLHSRVRAVLLSTSNASYTAQHIVTRLYSVSSPNSTASDPTTTSSASATPPLPEKPDYLDDAESAIWDSLVAEFAPTELIVQDISGGCGSMYGIEIASEKFRGSNMLKQQRMVNAVLGDKMKSWHGIQLRTKVP
ncbi:hypothetical protein AAE478_003971 [Parahypoxylon ruwenzoriense]